MGNICPCPIFFISQEKSPVVNNQQFVSPTHRNMTNYQQKKCQQQVIKDEKKVDLSLNTSGKQMGKAFTKCSSTGFGSGDSTKRISSLLQTNFDFSSIVILVPNQKFPSDKFNRQQYYVLISKKSYVKKSPESIIVQNPCQQIQLNCNQQSALATLFLAQGVPIDEIVELQPKKYIQNQPSPVSISFKMFCNTQKCNNVLKMIYSKCSIQVDEYQCKNCNKKNWTLSDVKSNFPIWGDGEKIKNGQSLINIPKHIRVIGCVQCLRFVECQTLPCQCLICLQCRSARKQHERDLCKFCFNDEKNEQNQ